MSTSSLRITNTQTHTTYVNTTIVIEAAALTMNQSASGIESRSTIGALSKITDPALLSSYQTIWRPTTFPDRPISIINGSLSSPCTRVDTVTVYATPTMATVMTHTVTVTGAQPQANLTSVYKPTTTGPVAGSPSLMGTVTNSYMSISSPTALSSLNFSSMVAGYRTGHGGSTPASSSSTKKATTTPPAPPPSSSSTRITQSTMGPSAAAASTATGVQQLAPLVQSPTPTGATTATNKNGTSSPAPDPAASLPGFAGAPTDRPLPVPATTSASLNFSAMVAGYRTPRLQATGAMSPRSLLIRAATSIAGPLNFDLILEENKAKKPSRTRTSTSTPDQTGTGILQVRDEHSTPSIGAGGQHASLTTKTETGPRAIPHRQNDARGYKVAEWLRKMSKLFTPTRPRETTFVTVPRTGRTEILMATTTQTL